MKNFNDRDYFKTWGNGWRLKVKLNILKKKINEVLMSKAWIILWSHE